MKKFARSICLLAVPALLLVAAGSTHAQEGAQPKTPPTPTKAVLENWNDVGNRLITMAQDWPEEKYTYKLTPAVRTFQEVILHIAGSNYDIINHQSGTKVGEAQNDPPASQYKTKAQTVAYLKKSVEDGAALLQKEGDAEVLSISPTGSVTPNTWASTTDCWWLTTARRAECLRSRAPKSSRPTLFRSAGIVARRLRRTRSRAYPRSPSTGCPFPPFRAILTESTHPQDRNFCTSVSGKLPFRHP